MCLKLLLMRSPFPCSQTVCSQLRRACLYVCCGNIISPFYNPSQSNYGSIVSNRKRPALKQKTKTGSLLSHVRWQEIISIVLRRYIPVTWWVMWKKLHTTSYHHEILLTVSSRKHEALSFISFVRFCLSTNQFIINHREN